MRIKQQSSYSWKYHTMNNNHSKLEIKRRSPAKITKYTNKFNHQIKYLVITEKIKMI